MMNSADVVGRGSVAALRAARWPELPPGGPAEQWRARAADVAEVLAADAAERDRAGEPPHAEAELLKAAGLVTVLGPAEHGGGGQRWSTAHHVVRALAAADGSIGHLLAHHYAWVWLAEFIGTDEKIEHIGEVAVRARWLFGGPSRVREAALEISDAGSDMVFRGEIDDPIGCQVCDIVMLEGRIPGRPTPISALAMATEPGFSLAGRRTGFGLRRSASAPVLVDDVAIPWTGALGHVNKVFRPRTYNAFLHPTLDLGLANVFLGLARGALDAAADRARASARAAGVLGALLPVLWQAEAFADEVAREAEVLHDRRRSVDGRDRDGHRVRATAVLDRAAAVAEEVCRRAFDAVGTADADMAALGRFWRDVRALAARVAPDIAEVGHHFLTGGRRRHDEIRSEETDDE
ncbi:hypothetical protein GCM10023222_31480 [Saccharopolyspora cebuensis]